MQPFEITARGMTFQAYAAGPADGRTVVLLHGFPETSACWRHVMGSLGDAGFRAVAVDQRGYSPGARPDGVEAYEITELVDDVVGWLDALGLDRVDLVGHDWGAAVGWAVAGLHPTRVRSLCAVSVPHSRAFSAALRDDEDQRERSSYFTLLQIEGKAEDVLLDDDARRLRRMYGETVPAEAIDAHVAVLGDRSALTAALNYYRAMSGPSFRELGPVSVPTLYVWSDADTAIGRTAAEACGEHVDATYRFVALDGVTHWIPEQAPDRLATPLLEHLAAT